MSRSHERLSTRVRKRVLLALSVALVLSACSIARSRPADSEIDQTVGELIQSLASADEEEHSAAVSGLVALGPHAPEALSKGLGNPDEDVRLGVVEALAQMPAETAVPLLLTALDDESWDVRLNTVEALGTFRDRRAVQPLMKRFEVDDDDQVRYECLTSLGLIGDPAAVDLLVKGTSDEDPYVRMWAMDALCQMADPHAETLALELLDDPNGYVRYQVLASCGKSMNTPAGNAKLIDIALTAERFEASALARRHLGEHLASPGSDSQLRQHMREAGRAALGGKHALRSALLLADIKDASGKDELVAAGLHDPNPFVRHQAAFLLGRLGDASVVPALIETLQDEQPLVAVTAFQSLKIFARKGDSRAQSAIAGYAGKRPE